MGVIADLYMETSVSELRAILNTVNHSQPTGDQLSVIGMYFAPSDDARLVDAGPYAEKGCPSLQYLRILGGSVRDTITFSNRGLSFFQHFALSALYFGE